MVVVVVVAINKVVIRIRCTLNVRTNCAIICVDTLSVGIINNPRTLDPGGVNCFPWGRPLSCSLIAVRAVVCLHNVARC